MAKHHIVGDESPFMKRVLIPFWVVRDLVMLFEMVLYGILIAAIVAAKDDLDQQFSSEYGTTSSITAAIAIAVVILLIITACLALDIVCMVKRSRRTLTPPFFFGVNIAQTVIWTILFVLSMIGSARSALTILIGIIIYLTFVGLLIYASVIYHRYRKGTLRGAYTSTVNPDHQVLVYTNPVYPVYPDGSYGDLSQGAQTQYELQAQPVPTYGHPSELQAQPVQSYGYPTELHAQPVQPHGYPSKYGS